MDTKKQSRDEAVKYEAEHYDEVPLWSSFRGKAVIAIGALSGVTSVHQIFLQEYVSAFFFILIVATLLYFIAKGYLWSIATLMLLIVFHAVSNWIYFGVIEQSSGAWLQLFFGFVLLAYFMMPTLRVEQKRRFLLKQAANKSVVNEGRVEAGVMKSNHEG